MPKHCAKKAQIFTGGVKFITQHRKVGSSRVLQWRMKLLLDSAVDVEVADLTIYGNRYLETNR
jgi:hypothetical protein